MAKTEEGKLIEENILSIIPKELRTKVMKCIRLALTGKVDGLSVGDIMYLIGPKETKKRINYMVDYYEQSKNI